MSTLIGFSSFRVSNVFIPQGKIGDARAGTKPPLAQSLHRDVKTEGRFLSENSVMMGHSILVPLDRTKFPLTLADGLRRTFADVVSTPLPERLAALVRCLSAELPQGE